MNLVAAPDASHEFGGAHQSAEGALRAAHSLSRATAGELDTRLCGESVEKVLRRPCPPPVTREAGGIARTSLKKWVDFVG